MSIAPKGQPALSLNDLHEWIDDFVSQLRAKKSDLGSKFIPWDYETRYDPETHIERGYIDADENVAFANHRDALKCFGYSKGHYQRGWWPVPNRNEGVWFPKFYSNEEWDNGRTPDGQYIYQTARAEKDALVEAQRTVPNRIVFAHDQDALGYTLYRFLGVYAYDPSQSDDRTDKFRLVNKRVDLLAYQGSAGR